MLTRDGTRLEIFENFIIDWNLPKFQKPKKPKSEGETAAKVVKSEDTSEEEYGDSDNRTMNQARNAWIVQAAQSAQSVTFNTTASTASGSIGSIYLTTPSMGPDSLKEVVPWGRRVRNLGRKLLGALDPTSIPEVPPEPLPEITIEQFFAAMKNSAEELKMVEERAKGYETAVRRAMLGGQTALIETLKKNILAVRSETQLLALGLPKYLDEPKVVEFVKKAAKGVRLDWVKNFTRVIPDDLLTKKVNADERGIFDNYAVMHYDPKGKSWAETAAETARRKDPILFGLINGRNRLYYVGDWVDSFCDLTLDQIADKLGTSAVSEIPPNFQMD